MCANFMTMGDRGPYEVSFMIARKVFLQRAVSAFLQITFLNALVWTRTPCKSTVRALHGVLYGSHIRGKDVFKDMYYKLAVSTGAIETSRPLSTRSSRKHA